MNRLNETVAVVFLVCRFSLFLKDPFFQIILCTRGVHLIVALGFCNAHYETQPYSIHYSWLMCSPLAEIEFLVITSRLCVKISRLVGHTL